MNNSKIGARGALKTGLAKVCPDLYFAGYIMRETKSDEKKDGNSDTKGCMIVNSLFEFKEEIPELRVFMDTNFAFIKKTMRDITVKGQAAGEITDSLSADSIAELF
jgi:hypothetical protein